MIQNRKYPFRYIDPDLTGRLKVDTLESFAFDGWHSSKDLYSDPTLVGPLYRSGWRCFSMRLLRYCRQGLLQRRRRSGGFEYRITEKGEDRLIHLWEKLGYLNVDRKLIGPEKRLMEIRLRKVQSIMDKRIATLDAKEAALEQELIESVRPHKKTLVTKNLNNRFVADRDLRSKTKQNTPAPSLSRSLEKLIEEFKYTKVKKRTIEL